MKINRNYLIRSLLVLVFVGILFQENGNAQGVWYQDSSGGYKSEQFAPRAGATALVVNGKIWVIGFDSLQIFDPITHLWSTPVSANSYIPSYGYQDAGNILIQGTACEVGGKIYHLGGYSYGSIGHLVPNSFHMLDTSTLTWSEPQTFGHFIPRQGLMSAVVNGTIYAIGGNIDTNLLGASGDLSTFQVFDTGTMTWSTPTTTGSLIPGEGQTACVVDGKIYVIGGAQYDSNSISATSNQVFDPSTNTWGTISSKGMFLRWYPSICALNGKIYLIGGQILGDSGGSGGADGTQLDIQIYDPMSDTWSTPTTMGTFNGVFDASIAVVNGKIYVLGGDDGDISNVVQVFTPDSLESGVALAQNPTTTLRVFPNPASGALQIRGVQSGEIHLFDLMGRERMNTTSDGTSTTLDVSSLPPGMYFVSDGSSETKFVKE